MSTPEQTNTESLLSAEKRRFELIANRVSLPGVLHDLCHVIDAHAPGIISTVMLTDPDGKRLWPAAGPRFPAALMPAISPWPIGPGKAACGTAAFLKQRVTISDIATDPRWPDDYRTLAVSHGLRADWSEPLISEDGAVLGAFGMYFGEPRTPNTTDLELMEAAGHIALIAIQLERSQAVLRESEERFRLVANTAPVMIWMTDVNKLCTFFNQPWLEFTGRPFEAELGNGWAQGVHSEDLGRCLDTYTKAFDQRQTFQMEYRLRRHDGEYRWVFDTGVPRHNVDGSFAGYIGSCMDVTERKLAEDALSRLGQRLIEAQEEERARIALELHDDINQRLALTALSLEVLKDNPPASAAALKRDIETAWKQVQDLGSDVRSLSHRLHSSNLEHLGLVAAAAGFSRELSERQSVEIDFHSEGVPKDLSKEISLCLFRVLQESLQNATRHSGSRQVQVLLTGGSNEIQLTVHDSGIGFDPNAAMKKRGLGLTSMKERLKLVNGDLSIESQLQRGTTIRARVPLTPGIKAAAAYAP